MLVELLQPITGGGIRTPHFFDGRLLSANDLNEVDLANRTAFQRVGRALGAGVAFGLEVHEYETSLSSNTPVVKITGGNAINENGQLLHLRSDTLLSLRIKPQPITVTTGYFERCESQQPEAETENGGVFVLVIGPVAARDGVVGGIRPGNLPTWDDDVSGVQFRLIPISLSEEEEQSPLLLRNRLAYGCFGFGSETSRLDVLEVPQPANGLVDLVPAGELLSTEVPLAIVSFGRDENFVDWWGVRRRLAVSHSNGEWTTLIDDRRFIVGEAMFLQFQRQLADIQQQEQSPAQLKLKDRFEWLPPAGIVPITSNGATGSFDFTEFFSDVAALQAIAIAKERAAALIRESFLYPPIRVDSELPLRIYEVRDDSRSSNLPYIIFASLALPFRGRTRDDVSLVSVAGIEAAMKVDLEYYVRDVSVIGREAYYLDPDDSRYTIELLGMNGATLEAAAFYLVRPWTARYRTIKDCMLLMAQSKNPGLEGFAKTIMAYQYLLNLNLTYDNGIRFCSPAYQLGAVLDRNAALSEISKLLDEGSNSLAKAEANVAFELSEGFRGFDTAETFARFNRALRARVAAYQNDHAQALEALGDSFLDVEAAMDTGVYHTYASGAEHIRNPVYADKLAAQLKLLAHPEIFGDREDGDQRIASKILTRSTATTLYGKTSDSAPLVAAYFQNRFPLIRNEELILLRAEANIMVGDLESARQDLNVIRTNAGLGAIDDPFDKSDTAIDELLKQRRYSLFLEGHRWIDLRRHNKLESDLKPATDEQGFAAFPLPQVQ